MNIILFKSGLLDNSWYEYKLDATTTLGKSKLKKLSEREREGGDNVLFLH